MHVVATAGHVDHGKSSLVRALTGMEPDRWAEERRRGLTIDLGFAWTTLATGDVMAFVDVPGHERFVTNMLAGVGSVPAALLVIAADEGWMPQTDEHVRALDALGVRDGLLVVTKCDLADPQAVVDDARRRLADTTLREIEPVAVSTTTGAGIDGVRSCLGRLAQRLPQPDRAAPVRLWVDRAFTIAGAGTVVTGTLSAGTVSTGDSLTIAGSDATVVVRGVQSRGAECASIVATARVALNLRGVDRSDVPRGTALVTAGQWLSVASVDALVDQDIGRDVVTHVGSAAVPTRVRRLGPGAARLQFNCALPLHYGDRLLLREPSSRAVTGATVADLAPAALRRRGDAVVVAKGLHVPTSAAEVVRRHGVVEADWLAAAGRPDHPGAIRVGEWWVDRLLMRLLMARVTTTTTEVDLAPIADLLARLAQDPLAAPDGDEVRRLDRGTLASGVRAGRLLDLGRGVYVAADAPQLAVQRLAGVDQPFTVSAAAAALASTRRVVVPLLEHLDAARRTRRLDDGTRLLVAREG